ncbi:cache domain-containing protein [Phreatobacter aquaticus]|nr:cache domain-containing protein [Phreatobacter aquaticus]
MTFATRLSLILAGLLALVLGTLSTLALMSAKRDLIARQRSELNTVSVLLRNALDRTSAYALTEVEAMARQPELRAAMAGSNAKAILDRFGETFAFLRAEAGLEIMQFQSAGLRTLARLHDPGRSNDDVSSIRPIVVAANRARRGQRGIEIGPTGILALRGVAPVVNDGQFVGTAEIGFDLRPVLQTVKIGSGAEVAIFISTTMTQAPSRGDGADEVQLKDSTDSRVFAAIARTPAFRLGRDTVQLEAVIGDERWGIVVEPLLDFSGRMIGGMVGAKDATALHAAYRRDALIFGFVAFVGAIVAFSVVLVTLRSFILGPLQAIEDYAGKVETSDKLPEPPKVGGGREVTRTMAAFAALAKRRAEPADLAGKPGGSA